MRVAEMRRQTQMMQDIVALNAYSFFSARFKFAA